MISIKHIRQHLESPEQQTALALLYGNDLEDASVTRWRRLAQQFSKLYPEHRQVALFSTPGRTEVGGNHTDHQHGCVLCASVNLDIIAVAAPNDSGIIRLQSEGFDQQDIVDLSDLEPVDEEKGHSAALIRGIAAAFSNRGYRFGGFDAYTTSLVPKGSGLSSSAAFEVLVATVMDELHNGGRISPVERAVIGQFAENQYFGKPSGLMDQCGCSVGGFVFIDFEKSDMPKIQPIDLDFSTAGYSLVITNTGGSHADLTEDYASIPRDMKKVAQAFNRSVLREVDENLFWEKLPHLRDSLDDLSLLRAIHFFEENHRVSEQAEALTNGRIESFLSLVRASGSSSFQRLQNIYSDRYPREQPLSIALAISESILKGRGACRVHGGGFAGTIQAFVPNDIVANYLDAMQSLFGSDAPRVMQIRTIGSTRLI